jgi:hypothetical protein
MGYSALLSTEVDVDSPVNTTLIQKIKDNFDYLYSAIGSTGQAPVNGSFEIDSDADGIPDNWARGLYSGGSAAHDATTPFHGAKAYKFSRAAGAGNGEPHHLDKEDCLWPAAGNRPLREGPLHRRLH